MNILEYKQIVLVKEIVGQLNIWLEKDHYAIDNLMGYIAVRCNDELSSDKDIVTKTFTSDYNGYIGTIGLLNSLLNSLGSQYHIVALHGNDDDERITSFAFCEK